MELVPGGREGVGGRAFGYCLLGSVPPSEMAQILIGPLGLFLLYRGEGGKGYPSPR